MFKLLNYPFEALSSVSGLPLDQAKIASCLISSFIFSIIFRYLRNPHLRTFLSLFIGGLYVLIVYEREAAHTLLMALMTYLLVLTVGRKCGYLSFIATFTYLTIYQIYRYWMDWGPWAMDASFVLMINTGKLTSFACCYEDGGRKKEELSEDQEYRKLEKMPSLYNFLAYMYFFPSALIGPMFDYKDFENLIHHEGRFKNAPKGFKLGFVMLLLGFACSFIHDFFSSRYPVHFINTAEFAGLNFGSRLWFTIVAGFFCRFKFRVGFYLAQASIDACGLSYNGEVNGKSKWDAVECCGRIPEVAVSAKDFIDNWNTSVQVWLRRYVYVRIMDSEARAGKKPNVERATLFTFLLSAFWHGINPTYFIEFVMAYFTVELGRNIYRMAENLKLPHWLHTLLQVVSLHVGCNCFTANHFLYYWRDAVKLLVSLYGFQFLYSVVLSWLLKMSGLSRKRRVKDDKKKDEKEKVKGE